MEKLLLTDDLIRRRLRKDNNVIIIFGAVLLFFGVYTYLAILIGLLVITLGAFFRIKDNKAIKNGDFHIILNPVNALDISQHSTDVPEPDYVYFNFHETCGRYRYCLSVSEKELFQAKEGDMYYLVFTQKREELFTSVDCIFPADSTALDDVLLLKLQTDAYLTGYILSKGMELKQKTDLRKGKG